MKWETKIVVINQENKNSVGLMPAETSEVKPVLCQKVRSAHWREALHPVAPKLERCINIENEIIIFLFLN